MHQEFLEGDIRFCWGLESNLDRTAPGRFKIPVRLGHTGIVWSWALLTHQAPYQRESKSLNGR